MLTRRIIPCLDVCAGRVVKGVRFRHLRDSGDPAELAARYQAEGADELTLLDISATSEDRATAADTVARVRRVLSIPLTVGGGVRSIEDIARLLDVGADKVGVNTAAVLNPGLIEESASRFGAQCTVVAIDARRRPGTHDIDSWDVIVRSGTSEGGISAVEWSRRAAEYGAGEILLTSWDRDGTRSGYDLDLVRRVSATINIPVIASGGASGPHDLLAAIRAGADAVLAASIFHNGEHTVRDAKVFLTQSGVAIRNEDCP